jgi:hypothetical protein
MVFGQMMQGWLMETLPGMVDWTSCIMENGEVYAPTITSMFLFTFRVRQLIIQLILFNGFGLAFIFGTIPDIENSTHSLIVRSSI